MGMCTDDHSRETETYYSQSSYLLKKGFAAPDNAIFPLK